MTRVLCWLSFVLPLWYCGSPAREASRPAGPIGSGAPQPNAPAIQNTFPICVIDAGNLKIVEATHDEQTRDTLVGGRTIDQVFPQDTPPYAGGAEWFIAREAIEFQTRGYYWNGRPVVLLPHELRRVGEFRGIPLFAEVDEAAELSILFVPVRRGCEFQPYYHFSGGPIRGK